MGLNSFFIDEMQLALSKLDVGQIEHLNSNSCALLDYYIVNTKLAAVVIQDEFYGETKKIAMNVDELLISNMLDEITGLMSDQFASGVQMAMQLN